MRNAILIIVCLVISIPYSYSQHHHCGVMPGDEDSHRLRRNIAAANTMVIERDDPKYIPINFIITTDNFGVGAIKEDRILNAVCKLNELYEPLNFQFYLDGPSEYLASNIVYEQSNGTSAQRNVIYNDNKRDSTINVFVGNNTASGASGYYSPSIDIIFMDKDFVNSVDVILAHEIGHYLSLRHPFYGWESVEIFNPDDPTPTHLSLNGSSIEVEYVDREVNCQEAADLMCGTPADYIRNWGGGCNYLGGAVDPSGTLIDPDEQNIMGYFSFNNCNEYIFSEDQMDAMISEYSFRPELNTIPEPNLEPVTEAPQGLYPIDDVVVDGNNSIQFSWTEVENADLYIVEFSPHDLFILVFNRFIVDQPTFTLNNVVLSDNYYWRVKAINKTNQCDGGVESEVYQFETKDLVDIKDNPWPEANIYPNPTTGMIFLTGITLEDKSVSMTNLLGNSMKIKINTNNNTIDVNDIPSGTYLLNIRSEERSLTKKIIVQ